MRPSTWYEFEVRYVARADNIVTHYSEPTRLAFFTAEQTRNEIAAAAESAKVPADVTEWIWQGSFDGVNWITQQSGTDADFTTVGPDTVLDLSSLTKIDGVWYRLGTRTVDASGDTTDWHFSLPYQRNGASAEPIALELVRSGKAITTGANVIGSFPMPFTADIVDHELIVTGDVSTSGVISADVLVDGAPITTTEISIDANETSSDSAATPAAFSSTAIAKGALLSIDINAAGTGATGPLWLHLIVERQVGA